MGFWAAVQFLTVFPSPVRRQFSQAEIGASLTYFPLIGLFMGLVLWGTDFALSLALPIPVVSALLLVVLALMTGALHLDGFIDTCDGIALRKTISERLDIMKDSRVGAFGVVGGSLLLLIKFAALISLPDVLRYAVLVMMPVIGRWAMVYAIYGYPYARPKGGTGSAYKKGAVAWRVIVASIVTMAIAVAIGQDWHGLILVAVVWIVIFAMAAYFRNVFGGLTGDSYGAVNEVAEVTVLILMPVIWRI
ncbi:adenosylcobinamide-GDP ribazoletransferase [Chloroflexota bacterium]